MGGGLGGGSSDAATTLFALNRLWGVQLPRLELQNSALNSVRTCRSLFSGKMRSPKVSENLSEWYNCRRVSSS